MKDIENKSAMQSAAALTRLQAALARLERAAANRAVARTSEIASLPDDVADLARRHEALRKSAGQVAVRLEETISHLAALMDMEG